MKTMLKTVLATGGLVLAGALQCQAALAVFGFEVNTPADATDSTTFLPTAADSGVFAASSFASASHASAGTDWTTPVGNGSANSISANTWAVGDYFQFSGKTIGFQDIKLGWAQTSSATGPGQFTLQYQVNGGGIINFLDYTVRPNQVADPGLGVWNSTTAIPGYGFLADFSAVTALDNAASVVFRLTVRTAADSTPPGTLAATGTSRVDDFIIDATAIPEPSTYIAGALLALPFGVQGVRYLRNRKRA